MGKVKSNIIYQIIYQILSLVVPLITTPYISRIFASDLLGEHTFAITVANYFVLLAMLGINNLGARNISKVKDDKNKLNYEFSRLFVVHFVISLIMLCAYLIFASFYKSDYSYLMYIGIIYLVSAIFDINWLFFGLEEFKVTITRNIFVRFVSITLIFCFVKNSSDLWKFAFVVAASNLISNLCLWCVCFKYVSFVKVKFRDVMVEIKPLLVLFIPIVSASIYRQMDKIMLPLLYSSSELGYYEQSEKMINIGVQVMSSVGVVMMPRFAYLYSEEKQSEASHIMHGTNVLSAFMSCAIAFGFAAISTPFTIVFLGDFYLPCDKIMLYLSPVIIIMSFANVVRTQYLIPKEKDFPYVLSAVIGAIVNLGVNLLLIPILGAIGAVIGTVTAELIVAIVQCIASREELPLFRMIMDYAPFLCIGLFMFIIVRIYNDYVSTSLFTLIISILIGGFIYVVCSIVYLALFKREMVSIIFKKRKR